MTEVGTQVLKIKQQQQTTVEFKVSNTLPSPV